MSDASFVQEVEAEQELPNEISCILFFKVLVLLQKRVETLVVSIFTHDHRNDLIFFIWLTVHHLTIVIKFENI